MLRDGLGSIEIGINTIINGGYKFMADSHAVSASANISLRYITMLNIGGAA